MTEWLGEAAAGLWIIGATFVALLLAKRLLDARRLRRTAAREEAVRPHAMSLLDGDPPPPLGRAEGRALAALLGRYARALSGESHAHIADWFEREGHVDAQLRDLRSRRAWVRAAAAFVLGDMGSRRAVPPLSAVLRNDRDRAVRAAAARSLGRLGSPDAVEPLVRALVEKEVPRATAAQALLAIGPAALPPLHALARHPEPELRAGALSLIGWVGSATDARVVQRGLRDTAAPARAAAAGALGRLGAQDAAEALRRALDDRVPYVRAAAAKALGRIRDEEALAALIAHAATDDFEPAREAARAAADIDPSAVRTAATGDRQHLLEAADMIALGGRAG